MECLNTKGISEICWNSYIRVWHNIIMEVDHFVMMWAWL